MRYLLILFFTTYLISFIGSPVSAQTLLVIIEPGDTLWDIAKKHLGDGHLWKVIADYNNLKNPDLIHKLNRIKIPEIPKVKVTAIIGEGRVKRSGSKEYVSIKKGDYLHPYDEMVTSVDSRAQLELEDKSVVQVKPETSIILKESFCKEGSSGIKTIFQLLHGVIFFKGTKTTNSEFEIDTPEVACGVRGTQFRTECSQDEVSRASVFEGMVMASAAMQDVTIPGGYGSRIIKGEPPSTPTLLPAPPEPIEPESDCITGLVTPIFKWKLVPEAISYHFELSRDDAFNDVVYEVIGTEATSIVSPAIQTGEYYWHVSSIDELGIEGNFSTVRILKVVKKLQVEVVPDSPWQEKQGVRYTSSSCQYTLKPLDVDTSIVQIMAAVDNKDFCMYQGPISFEKDGTYTLRYKGIDAFGESGEIAKFVVVVDNTPPEIKIEIDKCVQLKSGCFVHPQTGFSLTAIDNAAGVKEILYKIDDGQWTGYSGVFSISQEGLHRIGFQAGDIVNNQSKEGMINVIVDNTPPTVLINTDKGNTVGTGSLFLPGERFRLMANDDGVGIDRIYFSVDNNKLTEYSEPFSIPNTGTHSISFQAVDLLGNRSDAKTVEIIVEDLPPQKKESKTDTTIIFFLLASMLNMWH